MGATKTLKLSNLPAGAAGSKTFRAYADSQCGTTESNEGNNQLTLNYTVGSGVPNPPTKLSASDGTYTDKVRITWAAPSSGPKPTGYKIFRNTSNNSSGVTKIGTSSASPYDDKGASKGVTYWYWAKAYNSLGDSGFSNGDSGYRKK